MVFIHRSSLCHVRCQGECQNFEAEQKTNTHTGPQGEPSLRGTARHHSTSCTALSPSVAPPTFSHATTPRSHRLPLQPTVLSTPSKTSQCLPGVSLPSPRNVDVLPWYNRATGRGSPNQILLLQHSLSKSTERMVQFAGKFTT